MKYRLPTEAEIEAQADVLAPQLDAETVRDAFDDYQRDAALIFEGKVGHVLEAEMRRLNAENNRDEDDRYDPIGNWSMALCEFAFLTLVSRHGNPEGLAQRATSLAYINRVWPEVG